MDIQQKLKSPHQPFNNAFSIDQFVPNYTDALTNYGHAPANYHALQLAQAQAQAARLRALHSAVLNGRSIIGRDISLNPIANPVISPRISERLGLVIKKNHGASANSSTGANRDHDYPVFVPARQQSKETGRDSVGSNYSSESLMTPEERLNYILDHDNKGTFPGLISANHKISANKDANHHHSRVINRHTPIKALSEFLSEEVIAWRQGPPQCRSSDGLSAQSHQISANHGSQHRQKSVISDDPGLILGANDHGSTNRVIKQISEIASGRSCKPSKSDYSTNHNLLQRVPLIHHHRSEQSVANQAEIRGRIKADPSPLSPSLVISKEKPAEAANHNVINANQDVIKANQSVIKANHNVVKANHNPIKAAWLSLRGMNGGNHGRSKGHRSKSQLGEGDRTEDVISTNHSYSGQDKHRTNHDYRGQNKNHTNHSYSGQDKHHTNDAANHKLQNGWPYRCEGIMLKEAAMAMAMEEMEAKLMEARWRRDMAIAEMEQVRLAMEQKKKMAMAMPMDRDMGMIMDMHRDMGMAMDRDMDMGMGRLKGKKAAQAEAERKERKVLA